VLNLCLLNLGDGCDLSEPHASSQYSWIGVAATLPFVIRDGTNLEAATGY
jgi:hypothetical protein